MSEPAANASTTRPLPEVPYLDQLMQVRGRLVELGLDTEAEALGEVCCRTGRASALCGRPAGGPGLEESRPDRQR